jgi:hypothetical protein
MMKFETVRAAAGVVALLIVVPPSAALENKPKLRFSAMPCRAVSERFCSKCSR